MLFCDLLADKKRLRILCLLAWPAIVEQLLLTMVNYVDAAMVGSLGYLATAAVAINIPVTWLINGIGMGISTGFSVQVAHRVGAKDAGGVRKIIRQAMMAVVVLGGGLCVIGMVLSKQIPTWLGGGQELLAQANAYLLIYMSSLPFVLGTAVFSAIHRCMGNTGLALRINIVANLINVILNFLLIYPTREVALFTRPVMIWGMGWGVSGAAAATWASVCFSAFLLAIRLWFRTDEYCASREERFTPDREILGRAWALGMPLILERLAMNSGQLVMTRLVSRFGTMALAANQVSVTAETFCYLPAHGISHAATALVGQSIGACRPKEALAYGRISVVAGFVFSSGCAILLFCFSPWISGLFTSSKETAALAATMLRIVAASEPFLSAYLISSGVLRGGGDTRYPMVISLIGMWAVRMPFALLLSYRLGFAGIWVAMALDQLVKGGLCLRRVGKERWIMPV